MLVAVAVGLSARQLEEALQVRLKRGEVVIATGLLPGAVARTGCLDHLTCEVSGDLRGEVEPASCDARFRAVGVGVFDGGDQPIKLG